MPVQTIPIADQPFDSQVVVGQLTPEEVLASQRQFFAKTDGEARLLLWDIRGLEKPLESQAIFKMVEDSTEFWSRMAGGRTAILAENRDQLSSARLYIKLAEAMPRELQVFTSYDDAVDWLIDYDHQQRYRTAGAFSN